MVGLFVWTPRNPFAKLTGVRKQVVSLHVVRCHKG